MSSSTKPMTLGYVTNQYARASDTFIRGEVAQLRAMGHTVHPFSIRRAPDAVSDQIKAEQARTDYILEHGALSLLCSALIVTMKRPGRMIAAMRLAWRTKSPGLKAIIWQIAYLVEAAHLARRVESLGIQHLHVHFPVGVGTVTMLAAELSGVSYSLMVHGPILFYEMNQWALPEKIRRSAFTCCITHFCRSQCMMWVEPEHWSKLHIIHCGLDDNFIVDEPTPVPDVRRFVNIGRLDSQKGQLILLDAMTLLRDRGIDCEVDLVGDGPHRSMLEAEIAKRQLGDHIHLLGWQDSDSVRQLIERSRALVMPSFAEGLPVVFMESYALGRPVISTHIAGHPELIKPDENGWMVSPGDPEALAKAMAEALAAPTDRLTSMGRHGAELVRTQHNIKIEMSHLEPLFDHTINGSPME
ncbi:glycosyltransferase family 4 protein [Planctomycetales bacterium ZRK34]|nr:glycosyltransferase family 4 protein [Planctomycetales bacterium ZRK34]